MTRLNPALLTLPMLLGAPVATTGCVACDCVIDHISLAVVDADGDPIEVDEILIEGPEGAEETQTCAEGTDCSAWFLPITAEGTYELIARIGGVEVGSTSIDMIRPEGGSGCCTTVMSGDATLIAAPPSPT
ncbi:MAG TPA: hypothetical protein PKA64_10930 [Myxococcota bacterium]|nr:hypothetical protein [Myxococcota bacterium]